MEILMKLKCSPTPAHSPHSLKNVDHRQQSNSPLHKMQYQAQKQQQQQQHNGLSYQQMQQRTMDYNATTTTTNVANINCCGTFQQTDYMNMPGRCCSAGLCCSPQLPACCTNGSMGRNLIFNPQLNLNNNNNNNTSTINEDFNFEENKFEYKEPEENFVSIDDIKIKSFLMKMAEKQKQEEEEEKARKLNEKPQKEEEKNQCNNNNNKPAIVYEIIDLDDEEEREKLKRIKNQAEKDATTTTTRSLLNKNQFKNVNEEILQQVQQQHLKMQHNSRHSPNISLVPAQTKNTNRSEVKQQQPQQQRKREKQKLKNEGELRIIAQIELLDSSDEEAPVDAYDDDDDEVEPSKDEEGGNDIFQVMSDDEGNDALVPAVMHDNDADDDDDEDIPLAAAAVSCELECDDDNDEFEKQRQHQQQQQQEREEIIRKNRKFKLNINQQNDVLGSDDDYVDEHEEGLIVRWDELELEQEQQRNGNGNVNARNIYECFICGKRVQSNYNLRRHMMIHTGERPFGCDLCERRFREFSDLKKHRRRHAGDANFICMICRIKPPTECDPTHCETCDPKMGAAIALRQTNSEGASKASKIVSSALQAQKKILPTLTKMTTINKTNTSPPATCTVAPQTTTKMSTLPKIKINPSTNAAATATRAKQGEKAEELPPLAPLSFIDQMYMLDSIPAVHRSVYTKGVGLVERKEFPCPSCQRPFGTRHNLKRHYMIHTGEKPFSCTRCRKPFREYSTLKKHMITHARERWYKCLRCPDKFLDYLDYTKHKKTHPEDASASASSSDLMSAHDSPFKRMRENSYRHDDSADSQDEDSSVAEDCLECCECGQRFTDLDEYTEHIKAHEAQIMYYECFVCKKSLSDLSTFENHMKDAHGAVIQSDNEDDDECEIMIENEPKLLIMKVDGTKK